MLTWIVCPENDDKKSPITEEAFLKLAAMMNSGYPNVVRKSFGFFDKDKSGGVSRRELRCVL